MPDTSLQITDKGWLEASIKEASFLTAKKDAWLIVYGSIRLFAVL